MKKYNLSAIMKRAWELVKKAGLTISEGLKKAWKEAKKIEKNFYYYNAAAEKYCENSKLYVSVNHWEKGENDRYYFNIRRRNSRYQKPAGYWDEKKQEYVAPANGINLMEVEA